MRGHRSYSARWLPPGAAVTSNGLEPDSGYTIRRLRRGEVFSGDELVDESVTRECGVVEVVLCFLRRLLIPVNVKAVDGVCCVLG